MANGALLVAGLLLGGLGATLLQKAWGRGLRRRAGTGQSSRQQPAGEPRPVSEPLRAPQGLTAALLDTPDVLVAVLDRQLRIVGFNSACEAASGYGVDAVRGEPLWERLVPAAHAEPLRRLLALALNPPEGAAAVGAGRLELPWQGRHGPPRTIAWSARPVPAPAGEGPCVVATGLDITERVLLRNALQSVEVDLEVARKTAKLGTWHWDPVTRELMWSEEIYEILGIAPGSVMPSYTQVTGMVHPDDLEQFNTITRAALRERHPAELEFRIVRADGTQRHLLQRIVVGDGTGNEMSMFGVLQDVTERQRARHALQTQEHSLALAQAVAGLGSWAFDFRTGRLECSDEVYRIYGHEPGGGEMSFEWAMQHFHPSERGWVIAAIRGAVAGEAPFNVEHRIVRPSGEIRIVHDMGEVLRDEDGAPQRMLGVVFDITARRQAEDALRDSERFLRLAQRIAQTGSWERDLRTGQLRWSDETFRIFGMPPGNLDSTPTLFFDLVHPDDRQRVMQEFSAAIGHDAPYQITHRILRGDGGERIVQQIAEVFRDDAGQPSRVVGVIRDITAQQQAQEELRLSHERFFNILNMAPDAIITLNERQRIVMYNRGAEIIFGYSAEEVIGQHVSLLIPARFHESHHRHVDAFCSGENKVQQAHKRSPIWGLRKDGSEFPAEASVSKMRVHGSVAATVILRDITLRVAAEQALREANALLESRVAERTRALSESNAQLRRAATERERAEQDLRLIMEGTARRTDAGFLASLVQFLAQIAPARYCMVARINRSDPGEVRTVAFWTGEAIAANFSYRLESTPCQHVYDDRSMCFVPERARELYPHDLIFRNLHVESYLGLPLYDSAENIVGHLALFDVRSMTVDDRVRSIVSVFAARAGAELERMQARIELVAANRELQQILNDLKATQMQLIQSEKMGALGQLVAGIAHEINTPSGAIKNSVKEIEHDYTTLLGHMLHIVGQLGPAELGLYLHACRAVIDQCQREHSSTREQRQSARGLRKLLEAAVVSDPFAVSQDLAMVGFDEVSFAPYLPLLSTPCSAEIHQSLRQLGMAQTHVSDIGISVSRIIQLVRALKNHSMMDFGKATSSQLRRGLEDTLTILHNKLKHGIVVQREFEDLPPLLCFPDQLNQVWVNLILNAVQAMNGQGNLVLRMMRRDDQVVVEVQDDGPGVPPELQEKIFETYFTTKRKGAGMGLGLSISRDIVMRHNGRIELESRPGCTVFRVLLPQDGVPRPAASDAGSGARQDSIPGEHR